MPRGWPSPWPGQGDGFVPCLTWDGLVRTFKGMELHLTPDIEAKLHALVAETGRAADEFVQDALAGKNLEKKTIVKDELFEASQARDMISQRKY